MQICCSNCLYSIMATSLTILNPVQVSMLYDYEYTLPGGDGSRVSMKAGECYCLVEKKTQNWWAVANPDSKEIFFVPSSYVEEIRVTSPVSPPPKITVTDTEFRRDQPPRPPAKPKNLLEKMKMNNYNEKRPTIETEAQIELFNILTSGAQTNTLSCSVSPTTDSGNRAEMDTNSTNVAAIHFGEYWSNDNDILLGGDDDDGVSPKQFRHGSSMQSLDIEFNEDDETNFNFIQQSQVLTVSC